MYFTVTVFSIEKVEGPRGKLEEVEEGDFQLLIIIIIVHTCNL